MRRPFPDLPGFSAFPELNVRLYVEKDDRPGVWFLSLDAASALAVWGGRTFYHLPYHPWPLQAADASIEHNAMLQPWLPELDGATPALLHFARSIDVVVWPGERCG